MRECPTKGDASAREYVRCTLELGIMMLDLAYLIQSAITELLLDAPRSRERVNMPETAATTARSEPTRLCGWLGDLGLRCMEFRVLAGRKADGQMAYLHSPAIASPAQSAVHD